MQIIDLPLSIPRAATYALRDLCIRISPGDLYVPFRLNDV